MPIGTGLPSPATLLFNRPIRAMFLQIKTEPINFNKEGEIYEDLISWQDNYLKGNDMLKDSISFSVGSTAAVQ